MALFQKSKRSIKEVNFMNWRDMIEDPQIGEMYFDGQFLYMFKSLGDYPPEWINITPDIDTDSPIKGVNYE